MKLLSYLLNQSKITHVQDHTGTIFNADGIDLVALRDHVNANQGVGGFAGAQAIADEDFWTAEVDIIIPAALEGQITVERAEKLKAKLILEARTARLILKLKMYWLSVALL